MWEKTEKKTAIRHLIKIGFLFSLNGKGRSRPNSGKEMTYRETSTISGYDLALEAQDRKIRPLVSNRENLNIIYASSCQSLSLFVGSCGTYEPKANDRDTHTLEA